MKYFIANIPDEEVADFAREVSGDLAAEFSTADAHSSVPPHFTLQPPFAANREEFARVEKAIRSVGAKHQPAPMDMFGFDHFAGRVVYLSAAASGKVWEIQGDLAERLQALPFISEPEFPSFTFHLTVSRPQSAEQCEEMLAYLADNYAPRFTTAFRNIALLKKPSKKGGWEIEKTYEIV